MQEVVIDFLLANSASLRTALERRHTVVFGALQVHILSIEDLVILKIVAGRLRDRAELSPIVLIASPESRLSSHPP